MTLQTTMMTRPDTDMVLETIRDDFELLCRTREEDNITWTAPVCDLVELIHTMWARGYLLNIFGRRVLFGRFTEQLCTRLHIVPPKNAYAVINNIHMRKDAYNTSLITRLGRMIGTQGDRHPLRRFVSRAWNAERKEIND